MRNSSSTATSRSVRPTTPPSRVWVRASSASFVAARMRASSPSSLTARRRDTSPLQGTSCQPSPSASPRRRWERTVSPASSKPRRPPAGGSEAATASSSSPLTICAAVGPGHLFGRLGLVAEVGQEQRVGQRTRRVGRDHRHPAAAGEARQVAEVVGGADQQGVELEVGHPLREPARPLLKGSGRAGTRARRGAHAELPSSSARSAASASR